MANHKQPKRDLKFNNQIFHKPCNSTLSLQRHHPEKNVKAPREARCTPRNSCPLAKAPTARKVPRKLTSNFQGCKQSSLKPETCEQEAVLYSTQCDKEREKKSQNPQALHCMGNFRTNKPYVGRKKKKPEACKGTNPQFSHVGRGHGAESERKC